MSRYNKKCILCGTEYKYCNGCRDYDDKPSWYNIYCSENCRTIFNTIVAAGDTITMIEAKRILVEECDLSNKDKFRPDMLKAMNKILETSDDVKEDIIADTNNNIKEDVVKEVKEEIKEEADEEVKLEQKFYNNKKKAKRRN